MVAAAAAVDFGLNDRPAPFGALIEDRRVLLDLAGRLGRGANPAQPAGERHQPVQVPRP